MDNHELIKRDLAHCWHPYTQMKDYRAFGPIPVKRAKGVKIFDHKGNFYYDTISSWWCNVHGHSHPTVIRAIKKQLDSFQHVMFAGFTHEPAVGLAERLVKITPRSLSKVFFSDNGSTAVEVALKMSFQYWKNKGKDKKEKFLSLDRAYHGDTIGAMSVSGVDLYNKKFKKLLFQSIKTCAPYCYRCPFSAKRENCSLECLKEAERTIKKHSRELAAVIAEPLLLGAGGMIIYPVEYLAGLRKITRKHGVHLILDEVATGFGRTGKMFACEHAAVEPDIMCLSKGITAGYLPLGATLATEDIYGAFYADYDEYKTLYHGHTYTANPIACAAALASLELFEKEDALAAVPAINRALGDFLDDISVLPPVGDTRNIGVVGAFELVKNKKTKKPPDPRQRIGLKIYSEGLKRNLILRPLGNVIYLFLPLCVKKKELEDIFGRAHGLMKDLF